MNIEAVSLTKTTAGQLTKREAGLVKQAQRIVKNLGSQIPDDYVTTIYKKSQSGMGGPLHTAYLNITKNGKNVMSKEIRTIGSEFCDKVSKFDLGRTLRQSIKELKKLI